MNARQLALHYLMMVLTKHQSLTELFEPTTPALTKMLCIGVCRYYVGITAFLKTKLRRKPEPLVWVCLLLGLYQLLYLKKPTYATVKETVALLDKTPYVKAKGLVNAILRDLIRHPIVLTEQAEIPWLFTLLKKDWPTFWPMIIKAHYQHPPMLLRVNLSQVTRADYLSLLKAACIQAIPHPKIPSAIELNAPMSVTHLPGFMKGLVSVQDVSAQCMGYVWHIAPHERVLDACAAPGGKTGHLLERFSLLKPLVALDQNAVRLKQVADNMHRLQFTVTLIHADATAVSTWWDGVPFDKILLDAPCSATGIIRRHPDIRLLRTPLAVRQVITIQAHLLMSLWQVLAAGGQLLYITCSVLKDENDRQIEHFLKTTPDATVCVIELPYGRKMEYGWQCLPGEAHGDGFYYALLQKK